MKTHQQGPDRVINRRWNTHPGYISAVANRIKLGLAQYAPEDRDKVIIMFSAHSVPMKTVYKGDSYTTEISSTVQHVMKALGLNNSYILSWQSKGTSNEWLNHVVLVPSI